MAINFLPAPHVHCFKERRRQLQFAQNFDGTVEVIVHFNGKHINEIYQDSIFVQPKSQEQQSPLQSFKDLSKEQRKALLAGINAKTFKIVIHEGAISAVKRPLPAMLTYFQKIRSVTLIEK